MAASVEQSLISASNVRGQMVLPTLKKSMIVRIFVIKYSMLFYSVQFCESDTGANAMIHQGLPWSSPLLLIS